VTLLNRSSSWPTLVQADNSFREQTMVAPRFRIGDVRDDRRAVLTAGPSGYEP
jgi:hypothetical protein